MLDEELRSRTEAVSFLRQMGYHAFARDWAMGETIGVAAGPLVAAEIQGWRRMVYLAPSPTGWVLHDLMRPGEPPPAVASLRQACLLAIRALEDGLV
jgi:hypothetical protein